MADPEGAEPSLTNRLLARNGPGLHRRKMADGGEVVTGPTARRALRALNARAMTMDETIFVDEDFDVSRPEDAALYAHERHHQMESGGFADGHGPRDHEEIAARAIERMVLHRAKSGEGIDSIMRDVRGGRTPSNGQEADQMVAAGPASGGQEGDEEDPMAGYRALLASGKTHEQIVRELTQFVMNTLMTQEEEERFRSTDSSFF